MASPAMKAHAPIRAVVRALSLVLTSAAVVILTIAVGSLEGASASAGSAEAATVPTSTRVPASVGLPNRQVALVVRGLQTGSGTSVSQAVHVLLPE